MTPAQPPRRTDPSPPASRREPDEQPAHIDLEITRVQPARATPRLAAAMWLAAAFVVMAVLKPWGGFGRSTATLQPDAGGAVEATPVPTEDRSATGLALPICLGTGAWRVASLETWRERDVRVWRAIEPIATTTGPDDPAIPSVSVVADQLAGLGFCAPAYGADMPIGPARVSAWLVQPSTEPAGVPLRQVQPVGAVTPIAALYVPRSGAWTTGRIVFEYEDTGAKTVRWFAVDLRILPATTPGAPTPGP